MHRKCSHYERIKKIIQISICSRSILNGHDFTLHVGALIVTDSRLVIRVENMVTTSSLEDLEVDLNGVMSNYLRLVSPVLLSSLLIF